MSQIKIYGLASTLQTHKAKLSDAIHQALVTALQYPVEKKFQRFFALERADFIFPDDRSNDYLSIEVLMFEGRSTSAKKLLQSMRMQRNWFVRIQGSSYLRIFQRQRLPGFSRMYREHRKRQTEANSAAERLTAGLSIN